VLELAFRPDRNGDEPLYRQLAAYLRGLIDAGRLAGGAKLPASRELAAALGVARVTVVAAYEQLAREGHITSHVGQGSFVAPAKGSRPVAAAGAARSFVWSSLYALRTRLLEIPQGLVVRVPREGPRYDFRGGQTDAGSLPLGDIRRAFSLALRRHGAELGEHQDLAGWPPLRREIARVLLARGIECDVDEIAVMSGAQQAVDLAAHVLLDPGDTVVIEQPGYFGATMAFRAAQANVVGVGLDSHGLRTDELARILRARRVKLVYATPAAQSPTGVAMSEARRQEFLALADEHQTPILEDDYAAELRYRGPVVRALKATDDAGQVIYAGTFSKMLFPNLRVGFVVAPRPLLRTLVLARWNADGGPALLPQMALTTLLRSGELERHVRRLRKLYATRLAAMLEALRANMPAGTQWTEPAAGHGVWLTWPSTVDGPAVFQEAASQGILYVRGDPFFVDGQGASHANLSFARLPQPKLIEGIERLAVIVRRHMRRAAMHREPRRSHGRAKSRRGVSDVAN